MLSPIKNTLRFYIRERIMYLPDIAAILHPTLSPAFFKEGTIHQVQIIPSNVSHSENMKNELVHKGRLVTISFLSATKRPPALYSHPEMIVEYIQQNVAVAIKVTGRSNSIIRSILEWMKIVFLFIRALDAISIREKMPIILTKMDKDTHLKF